MKNLILTMLSANLILVCTSIAQDISVLNNPLFNGPETIAYDEENNKYFVGNATDGKLLVIDSLNTVTVFNDNVGADVLMDMVIIGDSLFLSTNDPATLTCINKNDGSPIYQINLEDIADACSQMVYDSRFGYMYIAEQYGAVIKVDINTQSCNIFATSGVASGTTTVEIDTTENRLILFSWSSPFIKYLNIDDSTDIYSGPSIGTLQNTGSMMDNDGYVYISSWANHEVIRAHIDSLNNAQIFCGDSLVKPVGITQDIANNVTAISNYGNNTITFISNPDTITGTRNQMDKKPVNMNIKYLPGSEELEVGFYSSEPHNYYVSVYDVLGRIQTSKAFEALIGQTSIRISVVNFPEGIYLVQLKHSYANWGAHKVYIR